MSLPAEHWRAALRQQHGRLLFEEERVARRWLQIMTLHGQTDGMSNPRTWLTWEYDRFLRLLRRAQAVHPGVNWGYPEG